MELFKNSDVFLNMLIVWTILIFKIIGTLGAWQPDIDINRLRLITDEKPHYRHPRRPHSRRSIFAQPGYDNDYHSSGLNAVQPPMQPVPDSSSAQKVLKVYKPREDPRLFYQSEIYAKEINKDGINYEVTAIYPGRDVVLAGKDYYNLEPSARLRERETYDIHHRDVCVTCPHDRTLIAKPGSDRVILQHPHLMTCFGHKAPREARFFTMYGPRFGSLLEKGSYRILGQIKYKNSMLKYCNMNVDVLIQTCALPKYLIADCRDENKTCTFRCREPKAELHGPSTLTCGDNMEWIGLLPVCRVRTWCELLPPPQHGRVSCKGNTVSGWGLAEGATCRARCARGWKLNSRSVASCRKGVWTHQFECVSKNV